MPEDVEALVRGTFSVMRHLRMVPGAPTPVENPVWIGSLHNVAAGTGGIFRPRVARGTYVQKGMKVGIVTDFFGQTIHEALAPESGVVLYVRAVPSAVKGDTLASIGVVLE
jgi:predicted deacylase